MEKLNNACFERFWELRAEIGMVDEVGSAQYFRVRRMWWAADRPSPVWQFIEQNADRLPEYMAVLKNGYPKQ